MLTRRSSLFSLAPLAMATALFGFTGCGFGPGDHTFYRVAVAAATSDAGCMLGPSQAMDTTTLSGTATFILYMGGDKEVELDTGTFVAPGTKTDTGYVFKGNIVNVDVKNNMGGMYTTTVTTLVTISMDINGSSVSGTSTNVTSQTCEGMGCPANYSCTKTAKYKGIQVDQAEVVLGSSPAPAP